MEHVIDVTPDGLVQSLHNDSFNLGFLGDQKIERASDIRFDEATQTWGIWLKEGDGFIEPGAYLSGFDSYDYARRFEVLYLNYCRLHCVDPCSVAAVPHCRTLRGQ